MSLIAHPYVVLAEQQWKQESLGGANRATEHDGSRNGRRPRHSRRPTVLQRLGSVLHTPRHAPRRRHTARPV